MKILQFEFTVLIQSYVLAAVAAQTTTAPPNPTAPALLRPSSGEIIEINQIYTVEWTPPPPGPLAIELSGNYNGHISAIVSLLPDTMTCTGWLINTECRKLNVTIPEGATSYIWNLTSYSEYFRLLYESVNLNLAVYIDDVPRGELPEDAAPWYVSGQFRLTEPPRETSSSTTTTAARSTMTNITTATTLTATQSESTGGTTSESETRSPSTSTDGSVVASETPTDAAVPRATHGTGTWGLGIIFGAVYASFC